MKRTLTAALLLVSLMTALLPHAAMAQSNPADDPRNQACLGRDGSLHTCANLATEPGLRPVDDSARTDPPAPSAEFLERAAAAQYLDGLQQLRSAWRRLESDIAGVRRQQRQGILDPSLAQTAMQAYPDVAARSDALLAELTPPARFAHVHELHQAASTEFDAALAATVSWLASDDPGTFRVAQSHFAQMDDWLDQALMELGY